MTLLLWMTVPWMREVTDFLRRNGILRFSLVLAGMGILGYLGRLLHTQGLTRDRRLHIGLLGLSLVYALVLWQVGVAPEERAHLLQVNFLALVWWEALREIYPIQPWTRMWRAVVYATAAGVFEEVIQLGVPRRQFDWRDIGMSLLAGGLASVLLCQLTQARIKRGSRRFNGS